MSKSAKYVNVVSVRVETTIGPVYCYAYAGDKTTYLKKNVDRYVKETVKRLRKAGNKDVALVYYECNLMTRVRADFAHQLCTDYKLNETRYA